MTRMRTPLPVPRLPGGWRGSPSRLTPEVVAQVRELDGQGMRKAAIAAATGVSETSVRNVLRAGAAGSGQRADGGEPALHEEAPSAPPAQEPPAGEPSAEEPGGEEPGGELPVLPDPVAQDAERALARLGLLGGGAARARSGELGVMCIEGQTRASFGKRDVQKMHVARLKFPGPATEETWVTDGAGDPLLVVMAEPSSSLAAQIKELLPRLREIAGPDRKPALCFDRAGWSPDLFARITDAGFHRLTYRTASPGEDIPDLPADAFTTAAWAGDDGREHRYELADGTADITVTKSPHKGRS